MARATREHALMAQQPAQQQKETEITPEQQVLYDMALEMAEKEKPKQTHVIYKLLNSKKIAPYILNAEEDVINPETKEVESLRLVRGLKSIWVKDQEKVDPKYIAANRRSLEFKHGVLRLPLEDKQAILRVECSNEYFENPNKKEDGSARFGFFKWDAEKIEKAQYEKKLKEANLIRTAMEMPFIKMKKHALLMGVRMNDQMGLEKTENGLRAELIIKVQENPVRFEKIMDTKEVDAYWMIRQAIKEGFIDFKKEQRAAYWSSGKMISKIPESEMANPHKYLIDLAQMSTEEGKEFYDELQRILKE